jgi:DNA-binding PadR family transcriptional regulator
MGRKLNLTYATGVVLQSIAAGYRYGFDIMDVSGLPDGTVYPALRRLERAGLLSSEWEDEQKASSERRPARCYYGLTPDGERMLNDALARFPGLGLAIPSLADAEPKRA